MLILEGTVSYNRKFQMLFYFIGSFILSIFMLSI